MAEEKSVSPDTAPAEPRQAPAPEAKTETFVPLIFGGAVACALGFFGGQLDWVEERLGLAGESELAALVQDQAQTLESQAAQIEALTTRLTAAEAIEIPEVEIPEVDLSGVTSALDDQAAAMSQLAARVDEIEKRPMTEGVSEAAIAAYEAELERMQAAVEAQRGEIEALIDEARLSETVAATQAQTALARAAMARVISAIDNGAPYADALSELQANADADVPAVLAASAQSGVATMAALRAEFPSAARAALSASRSGSTGGSVTGFLQKQLGVRSVAPREGSDPDAILSRAEAAVRNAQLDVALTELSGLPEAASAAMADWIALAETRHATVVAADDLMTALATN